MESNKQESKESISAFAYESALMHKDADVERAHKANRWLCITFIVIVIIFVTAYTVRTNIWLDKYEKLTAAIIELANAKGLSAP